MVFVSVVKVSLTCHFHKTWNCFRIAFSEEAFDLHKHSNTAFCENHHLRRTPDPLRWAASGRAQYYISVFYIRDAYIIFRNMILGPTLQSPPQVVWGATRPQSGGGWWSGGRHASPAIEFINAYQTLQVEHVGFCARQAPSFCMRALSVFFSIMHTTSFFESRTLPHSTLCPLGFPFSY